MSGKTVKKTINDLKEFLDKPNFPSIEGKILEYWDIIDAFKKSLQKSRKYPRYTFYDGPPFATGLPHYGHIAAGTIKDAIARIATQTGHYVPRVWGWDTHGVPIEFEIDKKLGLKTKEDIERYGIREYCDACREIVMTYSEQWKDTVRRTGRWVDFDGSYKTMDPSYMETCWWVFKKLYIKDLVYQGFKVMPYSSGCMTPLSNFESGQNYRTVMDPSVWVYFQDSSDSNVKYLVWTTTPWTLPSNLALCIKPNTEYCMVKNGEDKIVVVNVPQTLEKVKKILGSCEIINTIHSSKLVGRTYVPMFNYYCENYPDAFKIVQDDYVSTETGTGIVHQAPAFGEDDFRVCLEQNIVSKGQELPCPFDSSCIFTDEVSLCVGMYFKDANKVILKELKERQVLFHREQIRHEYPYCWRSDTPLMYRAVPCWFINVNRIKKQMLEVLEDTYWVPEYVKTQRFTNWIKNGVDWCVSRNRYWGTPMPVWTNGDETIIIGSTEELEKKAGLESGSITDLHMYEVDLIEIPSTKGGKPLRRIKEIFDCWFESGSMPYASVHYPFDISTSKFTSTMFPADFIAEGLDQTRGWFYTLTVLSTALFGKPAFKNVIVNGLVLAEDKQKMSKSKKNYPPPEEILDDYGADALRLYITQSKVVKAEELCFSKKGVKQIVQNVLLPMHHCMKLFLESAEMYRERNGIEFQPLSVHGSHITDMLDNWLLQMLDHLIKMYHKEVSSYKLFNVMDHFQNFITNLSKGYINLNKDRIKGLELDAMSTLYYALYNFSLLLAPFAPFYAEYMYLMLRDFDPFSSEQSVHFCQHPTKIWFNNPEFLNTVQNMFKVIESVRVLRERINYSFKKPLKELHIYHADSTILSQIMKVERYLKKNTNTNAISYSTNMEKYVDYELKLNMKLLGKRLGRRLSDFKTKIEGFSRMKIKKFINKGEITVNDEVFTSADLIVSKKLKDESKKINYNDEFMVEIVNDNTEEITFQYEARKLVSHINKMRAAAGLKPVDYVNVYYKISESMKNIGVGNANCQKLFKEQETFVLPLLKYTVWPYDYDRSYFYTDNIELFDTPVQILFEQRKIKLAPPDKCSSIKEIYE